MHRSNPPPHQIEPASGVAKLGLMIGIRHKESKVLRCQLKSRLIQKGHRASEHCVAPICIRPPEFTSMVAIGHATMPRHSIEKFHCPEVCFVIKRNPALFRQDHGGHNWNGGVIQKSALDIAWARIGTMAPSSGSLTFDHPIANLFHSLQDLFVPGSKKILSEEDSLISKLPVNVTSGILPCFGRF